MIGRVFVTPKPELLDPQGQAIRHSLHALGYTEVADVRFGKYLELEVTGADLEAVRQRLEEMCRRLLANEAIEEYRIEVAGNADCVEHKSD
jgi:phosphoribosylformylglycinamidine synthase PurS subunit